MILKTAMLFVTGLLKFSQRYFFAKCFGCVRFVYNRMLSDRIEYYKLTGKSLNNTPAQYKSEFTWLKEVDTRV